MENLNTVIHSNHTHINTKVSFVSTANILDKNGEKELSINFLRVTLMKDPKNLSVQSKLAELLESKYEFNESKKLRLNILKNDYIFTNAYKVANNFYFSGNDEQALKYYYEALSILKNSTTELFDTYKNIGNILVRQGDFEGAEENYNKALTLNRYSDALFVNYGTLEIQRNDLDKAIHYFREAVKLNYNNDKAWIGLALVHDQFSDHELAWANLEAALDINIKNKTAAQIVAKWSHQKNRAHRSIELLEKYLSQNEFDIEISLEYISLCIYSGNIKNAYYELTKVVQFEPANEKLLNLYIQLSKEVNKK